MEGVILDGYDPRSFEHKYFDSHGGTTGIEHLSRMGKLRSKEEGEVIKAKYRRLKPMGSAAILKGVFEYLLIEQDGTAELEKECRKHIHDDHPAEMEILSNLSIIWQEGKAEIRTSYEFHQVHSQTQNDGGTVV